MLTRLRPWCSPWSTNLVAEGVRTLPVGVPKLTLGFGVLKHAMTYLQQPDGPSAGELWRPTRKQVEFLLWWYAVNDEGRWLFMHSARRQAKGTGKSPFAAVIALEELLGPVRLKDFDPGRPGGCVGRPSPLPLVQIAATAESQTANTMRMVRAMTAKKSRVVRDFGLDAGKTIIYMPSGGQLETITSSAAAAEGAIVTFAVEDETEHWTPSTGGHNLADTLAGNLIKSGSRAMETANAWVPGSASVAENTWDAWVLQQSGQVVDAAEQILYDARVAPADTDLRDGVSLRAGLEFVYEDCPWVDLPQLMAAIWNPRNKVDASRRKYLNQPTAAENAWTTPQAWAACAQPDTVVDGEDVVLFFDGSKSFDATALMGCRMSDGYVFTVGIWQPVNGEQVDVEQIDTVVDGTFGRYSVVGFFADVREWEGFVKVTWPERYKDRLLVWPQKAGISPDPIGFDMRKRIVEFGYAAELTLDDIDAGRLTHDGNPLVAAHVANARAYAVRREEDREVYSIRKESRMSARKIDAAVCVIGARMVRKRVLESDEWEKYLRRKTRGRSRVVVM